MKKIMLTLMVLFQSTNAIAGWTLVSENDIQFTYVDRASISHVGGKVMMWSLQDYKTAEEGGNKSPFLSSKSEYEYNCTEDKYIRLAYSSFSDHMGYGNVVSKDRNISNWIPISSDSPDEAILEIACGKR
jgi:hypothetical protein